MRAIAATAGVTPGMIHHFFGSKQQVLLAAIHMPIDPQQLPATLTEHYVPAVRAALFG